MADVARRFVAPRASARSISANSCVQRCESRVSGPRSHAGSWADSVHSGCTCDSGGQAARSWSEILPPSVPAPTAGAVILAAHVTALRQAMDNALAANGLTVTSYGGTISMGDEHRSPPNNDKWGHRNGVSLR